ncbi:hypothetical protein Pint_18488 [Pistacia integerrima]|uniref:Uncharacterized protein n=1 Tax=Pistacia integerrima TaxID=434235 RepID=A0ACC0YYB4_9ROSI|nr:hypothetical protein Pint_18488 [Pistacia integerrima]
MKFGKEFIAQMVPEWQKAYMNYNYLKTLLKEILRLKQRNRQTARPAGLERAATLYRAFSGLIQRQNNPTSPSRKDHNDNQFILVSFVEEDGSEILETTFLKLAEEGGEWEQEFFRRLDYEFNKVDKFYRFKVQELMAEAENLTKQMNALIAFRIKVNKLQGLLDSPLPSKSNDEKSDGQINTIREENQEQEQDNNGGFKHVQLLEILDHVKLKRTLDTPSEFIKGCVSVNPEETEVTISRENLNKVENQLKQAFIEYYRKIRHLKSYSFMNVLAFSKIMKKYDKITSRKASVSYIKMVDNSYLGSSDEVTKLMERVEDAFIKYFSNSNRSKGMQILRPKAKKERHGITFSLGFCFGCLIALIIALIFIIHARDLLDKRGKNQYMKDIFPLYSVLANLDMEMDPETHDYKTLTELLPLGLVLLVIVILIFPCNVIYRSSRFFFLRCLFHCICAPLYKVTLQDFFLAEQLTSQRLETWNSYICRYGWGDYESRENTCKTNDVYKTFYFIVAVIPYMSRFLQCFRRLYEERDTMYICNGLNYFLTVVAISTRTAYCLYKGMSWKIISGIFSAIAALYGTYWDLVVDWGLLQHKSKNRWLRDKLLIPSKTVYFVAMVLNVLLRFAWLQTVLDSQLSFLHSETLIAIAASLEVIRRGIWNFFRLENEHLNNVGKYRAFKSVPLPFMYYEDEDEEKDE